MKDVIITGYSNMTKEGIVLHTNVPAKLKTGNVTSKEVWVSWDKIGAALFDDYTEETSVEGRNDLRKS
jgi:hypothetical protein